MTDPTTLARHKPDCPKVILNNPDAYFCTCGAEQPADTDTRGLDRLAEQMMVDAPTADEVREATEIELLTAELDACKSYTVDRDMDIEKLRAANAALRAKVAELEAELAREREDSRDIPTIAYMDGAADGKRKAGVAEAERDAANRKVTELLVDYRSLEAKMQRELQSLSDKLRDAGMERDVAKARVETLEWLVEVQSLRLYYSYVARKVELDATLAAARAAAGV